MGGKTVCGTPSLSPDPGHTIGPSCSSPWKSISQQILSTTASLLELSTCNCALCALCHLGPDGHPLQVLWVTQLPAGVLHILCSVMWALHGGHHDTLMVPVPCSVRGPSKRVMYHPVLGPGLSPRSKPCLHNAPAAGLELIWLPETWSASSCALLSHSINVSPPQSHPTPTQRPLSASPQELPSGHDALAIVLCNGSLWRWGRASPSPTLK